MGPGTNLGTPLMPFARRSSAYSRRIDLTCESTYESKTTEWKCSTDAPLYQRATRVSDSERCSSSNVPTVGWSISRVWGWSSFMWTSASGTADACDVRTRRQGARRSDRCRYGRHDLSL